MQKILKRNEVEENLKWDLTHLYKNEQEFEKDIMSLKEKTTTFKKNYENNLKDEQIISTAIKDYEEILILLNHISSYASLSISVDMTDNDANIRYSKTNLLVSDINAQISFFESYLSTKDTKILENIANSSPRYQKYINDLILKKPHMLSSDVEEILKALSPALDLPENLYENNKQMDIAFENIDLNGTTYPMSYVKFENDYCFDKNNDLRRKSYEHFYKSVDKYKHTIATSYNAQVQKEKIIAKKRGFDSVINYLLFSQQIPRATYDKHIDTIMEKLAPVMQRYAKLIQKENKLDKMTFADLKLPLYSDFAPKISIEDSKELVKKSLSLLGDEYINHALKYDSEKWVDYAQNAGKQTGGFCASPYGGYTYILLSWTGLLSEVYTLVHEIGHGVHFRLSDEDNSILSNDPSTALVEAPSTFNEMLLTNHLIKNSKTDLDKKHTIAYMIENTYYHNFVTHFLEADYQRKVYNLVDEGQSLNAYILSDLMKETYKNFFGDDIDLTGADLTWIRQPHYYNGLYSYTYSFGLSVATSVYQKIANGDESMAKKWVEFLKAGGEKAPIDLCNIVDVDITNIQFVEDTIDFISKQVEKLEK